MCPHWGTPAPEKLRVCGGRGSSDGGACAFYYILFKEKPSVMIPKAKRQRKDFFARGSELTFKVLP